MRLSRGHMLDLFACFNSDLRALRARLCVGRGESDPFVVESSQMRLALGAV